MLQKEQSREGSHLNRSHRNLGLDFARTAAIVVVVVSHLIPNVTDWKLSPNAISAYEYMGVAGVELFFSLSGFLIGQQIIALAGEPSFRQLRTFWFKRWMRTLPLYYVALITMSFVTGLWDIRTFYFFQNFQPAFTPDHPTPLVVAWSLVLEEWFYFFFPIFILIACATLKLSAIRITVLVAVIVIIGATAARAIGQFYPQIDPTFHAQPVFRLDCAAYGVLAACLYRSGAIGSGKGVAIAALVSIIFACAYGVLFVGMKHQEFWDATGLNYWYRFMFPIRWTLLDIVFAWLVFTLAFFRGTHFPAFVAVAIAWISTIIIFNLSDPLSTHSPLTPLRGLEFWTNL
ncbi:Acyltransferase family protein [Bradyrhizobium brasilense]|uniref:Acyltransferase family protein n=1 Tax=Bradyrhizobium brasilense TaxID=1419277 RepID=A0A1G6I788_9BRAD|nr:acyltransferase [Bradyrhizobium brasilense]SDC02409.1 Acyltransferase family protein [Bradyrhizobium brasilense]